MYLKGLKGGNAVVPLHSIWGFNDHVIRWVSLFPDELIQISFFLMPVFLILKIAKCARLWKASVVLAIFPSSPTPDLLGLHHLASSPDAQADP